MTGSLTTVLYFGNSKLVDARFKPWERILMMIGGMSSALIVMFFTIILLIQKFN